MAYTIRKQEAFGELSDMKQRVTQFEEAILLMTDLQVICPACFGIKPQQSYGSAICYCDYESPMYQD